MEELILMRFWLSIAPLLVKGFTSPNSQCLNSCDATCGIRTANGRRRNRRGSLAGFPLSLWCHLLRQLRDVNKVDVGHGRSARRHWVSGGNVPDREECSNVVVLKTTYDVWFWDILSCFTKKKKRGGGGNYFGQNSNYWVLQVTSRNLVYWKYTLHTKVSPQFNLW